MELPLKSLCCRRTVMISSSAGQQPSAPDAFVPAHSTWNRCEESNFCNLFGMKGQTGGGMEALTALQVVLLTLYEV